MTGRFLSLEGGEGAGKSTQARALAAALEARGIRTLVTREPGGSEGAEAIRALLMQGDVQRWSQHSEALLFAAARADHVEDDPPGDRRGNVGDLRPLPRFQPRLSGGSRRD